MLELINKHHILHALESHIGEANGIAVKDLVEQITKQESTPAAERKLRERVEGLRMLGEHICAHPSTGYYMAANEIELNRSCKYLIDRAMTSIKQVSAMKRVSLPDLYGQLRIKL